MGAEQAVPKHCAPTAGGENFLDPATKTYVNNDPARYCDYALIHVILFQLHDHITHKVLHQDPQATNYYGHQEVDDFLRDIMRPGSSRD